MESYLVHKRELARKLKNWALSDKIRNELDEKGVIIFDTNNGQEVYYTVNKTRKELIKDLQADKEANARFDAWLFSQLNN